MPPPLPTEARAVAPAEYDLLQRMWAHAVNGADKRYDAFLVFVGFVAAAASFLLEARGGADAPLVVAGAGFVILSMGVVTFLRTMEFQFSSVRYARGLNALRGRFVADFPELGPSLVLPKTDDVPAMSGVTSHALRRTMLTNRPGAIALVNSLVAGLVGGTWSWAGADGRLAGEWPLAAGVAGAAACCGLAVWLHLRAQQALVQKAEAAFSQDRERRAAVVDAADVVVTPRA